MLQFFWDTFGFIADNVSRNIKLLLAALLFLAIFFFFGATIMFYAIGLVFWIADKNISKH